MTSHQGNKKSVSTDMYLGVNSLYSSRKFLLFHIFTKDLISSEATNVESMISISEKFLLLITSND